MHYGYPAQSMQCVGVTGTDGKTSTTELIAHILRGTGKRTFSVSTVRIQMDHQLLPTDKRTTPSPWKMQKLLKEAASQGIDFLVMEISSHAISQSRISGINFDVAVLTNITPEHLDYHHTFIEYQKSKKQLFLKYLKPRGTAVLNSDDPSGRSWSREFLKGGKKVLTYTTKDDFPTNWQAEKIITRDEKPESRDKMLSENSGSYGKLREEGMNGIEFSLRDKQRQTHNTIFLPLRGIFNVSNALSAMQAVFSLGINIDESASLLRSFPGVPGRMEEIDVGQEFFIFVDFALTPGAFRQLLHTGRKIAGEKRVILVFGSPGSHPDPLVRRQIGKITAGRADILMVTDDEPYFENPAHIRSQLLHGIREDLTEEEFSQRIREIPDRREAIQAALHLAQKGDVVIISGMGHLKQRNIGGEEIEWNDKEVIKELMRKGK